MSCKDRKYAMLRCNNGEWQAYSNCSKVQFENNNVSDKYVYVFDNDANPYENALNKKHEFENKIKKFKIFKFKEFGFITPYVGWDVYRLNSKKCPIELLDKVDGNNNYEFKLK